MTTDKLSTRAARKLAEIEAAGDAGLSMRNLTAAIHELNKARLITIYKDQPITRNGGVGWSYIIKIRELTQ